MIAFETFDLMVAGIEAKLPEFVDRYAFNDWEPASQTEMIIAGWSTERDRPESYVININDQLPPGASAPGSIVPQAYKLQELPACVSGPPIVHTTEAEAFGFSGVHIGGPMEDIVAELVLQIEIQRRWGATQLIPCCVGGFAELTIIRPEWIEQSVLRRWPDKIGQLISPETAGQ